MKFMRYLPPLGLAAVIGLFGIFGPNAAYSTTVSSCSASLDGSQEVPVVDTTGNGMATVEFDPSSNEITWSIEFTNLSGPATAAHFHGPAAEGTNAGVQVNIGDESGLDSPMDGSAELTAEQVTMLMDGEMYINIHTDDNPNGEIRGQVSCEAAPDDGTGDGSTQSVTVSVDDEEFDIDYAIINGTIDEATADPETQTLLLEMSTTSNGNLTIWLPTELIDSEDEYAVLIDGEFGNFVVDELEPTADSRVLSLEFPMGAEEIEIVGTSMAGGEPQQQTVSIEVDGQTYEIPFEATGATVQTATVDVDSKTIVFTIVANGSGTLILWLSTDVIDAVEEFTVLVNGESANFTEMERSGDFRVLQIQFDEDTEEISVAGTSIVPEFGALSILALSMVTAGAIFAARHFRSFGRLRG